MELRGLGRTIDPSKVKDTEVVGVVLGGVAAFGSSFSKTSSSPVLSPVMPVPSDTESLRPLANLSSFSANSCLILLILNLA